MQNAMKLAALSLAILVNAAWCEEVEEADGAADEAKSDVLAGHSYHGEAFNEGPRQEAYLMPGLGRVKFPVTAAKPMAQKFVTQGVAQLHGFWYLEAERSFRQAAAIDAECAMAYWGMAMSNGSNAKRGKEFIKEAVSRKDKVSRREQLYIDALDAFFKADAKKKKERGQKYIKALERLVYEFPDDLEAKAFLALQLWGNRSNGVPISSYLAVDALLDDILDVEPMHPVHHYRIHLWDYEKAEKALNSAARCGQSLPAIAHMWHMPGHIYSRLKRYEDACWQQEASARVDHAHMMRDRVLPDQISNFAHNNEWLIRNLNYVGRVRDAVELAKNMIELPRHPKYNTIAKRGSTNYGRRRLFETLSRYELWEEMIQLCDSPYLEPTDKDTEQVKRLRHLGRAHLRSGNADAGAEQLAALEPRLKKQTEARDKAAKEAEEKAKEELIDKKAIEKVVKEAEEKARADEKDDEAIDNAKREAEQAEREKQLKAKKKEIDKKVNDAKKPFSDKIRELDRATNELKALQKVLEEDYAAAYELLNKSSGIDAMYKASIQAKSGKVDEAITAARKYVDSHKNEVQPRAMLVEILWNADKKDDAREAFKQLQDASRSTDLASPVFTRLAPIAKELGLPDDWRNKAPPADDLGVRPSLDSLGPFRWQPSPVPDFVLTDAEGKSHTLKEYQGRPVIVIFYLGYECLHCAEQLQSFAPKLEAFREAGIEMVAISTDNAEGLKKSIEAYDKGDLPIPLLSNAELDVFKAFRAYDDFEKQPLHGTFLIDGDGMVRWQDISYEPFNNPDFVLQESQRLLSQSEWASSVR